MDPAPSAEDLQEAAELALRAPDHQGLRPFRLVHVSPEDRSALGDLFARAAAAAGRDPQAQDKARARAHSGPALLAVVARIRDDEPAVPPHEQWLCVGAAVMNLLTALHLQGHGAMVMGGSAARSKFVREAFCHDGEEIACWVIAGTPADGAAAARSTQQARVRDLLSDWTPPPAA